MSLNLPQIRIQFPGKIVYNNEIRKDYCIKGYLGKTEVGYITLAMLNHSFEDEDDFWFEKKGEVFVPRPVVFFQRTNPAFFGQNVNEKLLALLNEETKKYYRMPLASSTNFLINSCADWKEQGYAERPAMRVWEKLEERGLAEYRPYRGNPRWVMK